jgi:hypothetical protein
MGKFLTLGPNMRRLGEIDLANSVAGRVVAGPGDLLMWEVRADVTLDGLPVQLAGRGSDIESSAAAVLAVLERDGTNFEPAPTHGRHG